ncbi:bifunctional riboflavin kinase/FAD synthetase [Ancylobacter mangrovi]|uniref:Riboflavin biosynthesis protein n=1 Tax=Ancylobacter mangrovi TaxID=2972472 RepID=A0A9X2PAF3_9HYPH|nr:bifunctional riboflavin kinase/FAD synthetase [Ancylobacter mangrovi]MCS0494996.1 bifunctional riboflavin kinase/FAD synthetase [Ancylobacter mangrovi]MCS0502390.1 bifunctional riboflavin kinase/FAD synthetase [Ancylobacter mangrovi]
MMQPIHRSHPFRVLSGSEALPAELAHPVVAIGNFDGVHRGHRAVIGTALEQARSLGRAALAVTFEPHPRSFFRPDEPVFRLTPAPMKLARLAETGLDGAVVLGFDAALAAKDAEAFVADILIGRLGVAMVVAGYDFHFGKGRGGSPIFLREAGRRHGFPVEIVPPLLDEGAQISSSAIRAALEQGRVEQAADMLGAPWAVEAEVIHGDKRGRELGYPTLNMRLDPAITLAHGIYAVTVEIDGTVHKGVASFGRRPTFDDGAPRLETFVFDYAGDLYGRVLRVAFHAYLRPELKFDSIEALITQMDEDSARARAALG